MAFLTSVAAVQRWLPQPVSSVTQEAQLAELVEAVEAAIASYTGRDQALGVPPFAAATTTEFYNGTGRALLVLRRHPVTAIAGVWCSATGPLTQLSVDDLAACRLVEGVDYLGADAPNDGWQAGLLERIRGVWPEGVANLRIEYTAGHETPPADLTLAAHQLILGALESLPRGGRSLAGESLGSYRYDLLASDSDPVLAAKRILDRYCEY